jgi:hypothetical protein
MDPVSEPPPPPPAKSTGLPVIVDDKPAPPGPPAPPGTGAFDQQLLHLLHLLLKTRYVAPSLPPELPPLFPCGGLVGGVFPVPPGTPGTIQRSSST